MRASSSRGSAPVFRKLVREQKFRGIRAACPLVPEHALALGVVAGSEVIHHEMAHHRFGLFDVRDVAGPAEECGLLEEVGALLRGQVHVDLLQMRSAVVAGDAGEIDAEEDFAVEDRQLVVGVELVDFSEIVAVLRLARACPSTCSRTIGIGGGHHVVALA